MNARVTTIIASLLISMTAALIPAALGQHVAEEAGGVARAIAANGSWLAEARVCPSNVMRERETRAHLERHDCKEGQLSRCLAKCSDGDGGACYWLAVAIQEAKVERQAYSALYQRACKLGVVSGCTNRAAGLLIEKSSDPSVKICSAETFSKACAFDDPWACTMYAHVLIRGEGVGRNTALALKVLEKSCRLGADDEACIAGMRLKKGLASGNTSK